ncbi:hypothetical protein [Micromonospora sp. NPDC005113]
MTRAPANLLAVRSLLLTHLDNAPGSDDLDSAEVGIVGDPAHRGGYHCGSDRLDSDDYSVRESPRDRAGLTLDAAALDVGAFKVTTAKGTFDLPHYSKWLVAQCQANTADTRDIREVIYSPDGKTVRRWDRLGRRSSGDSSHRWHTHKSYFRDAIKAGRDQTAVVRRYLTTIGILEDDMPLTAADRVAIWTHDLKDGDGTDPAYKVLLRAAVDAAAAKAEATKARLTGEATLAAVKGLDTKAVLARINEVAQAETERDAEMADLLRKLESGELTAEQVLVKLRDLLPAANGQQG